MEIQTLSPGAAGTPSVEPPINPTFAHAAGHLVIENVLGLDDARFSIGRSDSIICEGRWPMLPIGSPLDRNVKVATDLIIDLLAGVTAEIMALGPGTHVARAVTDLGMASATANSIWRRPNGRPDYPTAHRDLVRLEEHTRELVRKHWRAIAAVSQQLHDRGSISTVEVADAVEYLSGGFDA